MSTLPAADRRDRTRNRLSRVAAAVVKGAASTAASVAAVLLMIVWVVIGLGIGFTDRWLSVLFAVTSAVTFVMVFVIQHTTGRQLRAVLLKLDGLIHAQPDADDELIAAERRPLHEQDHLERDAPTRRPSTKPAGTTARLPASGDFNGPDDADTVSPTDDALGGAPRRSR